MGNRQRIPCRKYCCCSNHCMASFSTGKYHQEGIKTMTTIHLTIDIGNSKLKAEELAQALKQEFSEYNVMFSFEGNEAKGQDYPPIVKNIIALDDIEQRIAKLRASLIT